ncbi:MAG: hypothetical protein DRJ47_01575 [Thermoprotei archaeon]|nr:MAG: hypothetical protein DRJ47_01575 [Thermoprotei archaeon]
MRQKLYVGFKQAIPDQKWYLVAGGSVREWANRQFTFIGPIPSFTEKELPDRVEARRRLGVDDETKVILFSIGGTRAGKELLDATGEVAKEIRKKFRKTKILVAPGPRVNIKDQTSADVEVLEEPYTLYRVMAGVDCAVTLAGLSTITELMVLGIPAVLLPLKGHYEQEENAETVASIRKNFLVADIGNTTPHKLAAYIKHLLNSPNQNP